nr:hypothetical protein KitaXyl93_04490 [Kitasatospora sp. Xyl93]
MPPRPPGTRPGTGATNTEKGGPATATGETGFSDVAYDLISVQCQALEVGHDYGQYVWDAGDAGEEDGPAVSGGAAS